MEAYQLALFTILLLIILALIVYIIYRCCCQRKRSTPLSDKQDLLSDSKSPEKYGGTTHPTQLIHGSSMPDKPPISSNTTPPKIIASKPPVGPAALEEALRASSSPPRSTTSQQPLSQTPPKNLLDVKKKERSPFPSPRPSPRPRRKRLGEVVYTDQELRLDAVFLDNQDEIVISIRSGTNFNPHNDAFVRVECFRSGLKPGKTPDDSKETRRMTGMNCPRWGERLSFYDITVDELEEMVFKATCVAIIKQQQDEAQQKVEEEEEVIGFVELGIDALHNTGREQWVKVISHEGIVSVNHRLAQNKH